MSNDSVERQDERFPSLAAVRLAHIEMLRRFTPTERIPITLAAELDEFLLRARATGALLDDDNDRWVVQGLLDYWTAALMRIGRTVLDTTLDAFNPDLAPTIPDERCPFLGLDPFQEHDTQKFFGRRRLVAEILALVQRTQLIIVFGQSGSGKSSLLRSGILPALRRGSVPGSERWRYVEPIIPGSDPLGALARSVNRFTSKPDPESLRPEQLFEEPAALRTALASDTPSVLAIDQFEELFTLTDHKDHRRAFVSQVLGLVDGSAPRHIVLMTMRSDYETFIAQLPDLQQKVQEGTFRITPMDATELREAIEGPAAAVGLNFEAGVVEALMGDTLGEPAALPLLQFTLWKLWKKRTRNKVTWSAYEMVGGGRLALARSADAYYDSLIPQNQITARRILLRMVRPSDGFEVTSSRIRLAVLFEKSDDPDRVRRVLEQLIEQRLVRMSPGETVDDDQVEVAHEALIRNWPRLVEWLDQERQVIATRRRLEAKASDWVRLGSGVGGLLDAAQLFEAEQWMRSTEAETLGYDPSVTSLVQASRDALNAARAEVEAAQQRELEQARQLALVERQRADENALALKRIRAYSHVGLVLAVALLGVAIFAEYNRRNADRERIVAQVKSVQLEVALKDLKAAVAQADEAEAQVKETNERAQQVASASLTGLARPLSPASNLSDTVKKRIKAIVDVFEHGGGDRPYAEVNVLAGDTGHLTYGVASTSLGSGNLEQLIKAYCDQTSARFRTEFSLYLPRLSARDITLDSDLSFRELLRRAAEDSVMQNTQETLFDRLYFTPAEQSARSLGITTPLGVAVVFDSYVHGSFAKIRDRTSQQLNGSPTQGANEREWIEAYLKNRLDWMATHPRPDARVGVYRPEAFLTLVQQGNWQLNPPLVIRGVTIQ